MSTRVNIAISTILLVVFWSVVIAVIWRYAEPKVRVVNCDLVEISPDFTQDMREQCRVLRGNRVYERHNDKR